MEYCWAIKRDKILMPATTWVNLGNTMLSERGQSQKIMYCMIPLISGYLFCYVQLANI